MKFIASFVFIALAAVSSVAAKGCFSGVQPGTCDDAAYMFCHDMLNINGGKRFSFSLLGDSERHSRCYNTSHKYKCDMRVLNKKSSTRIIAEADCASAMFTNGNCDNGGKKTINGIEYTADPNEGTC